MSEAVNILYFDDSMTQLIAGRRCLTMAGFEVAIASHLQAALELVSGRDLVIVDFHMPAASGAAVLPQLRRCLKPEDDTVFYLYTSDVAVAVDYTRYGFDGAFTRKGSLEELVRQVKNVTKLIGMRRSRKAGPQSRP